VPLAELRKRIGRSQAEVAALIGTTQSGVSRIERQGDIKVSTLADYIEALGGALRVHAEFGTDRIELTVHATDPSTGLEEARREFRVVWQDNETRGLVPVGLLEYTGDEFVFGYNDDAKRNERFTPFPSLPDLGKVYRSPDLFPFFALRLISTADPHYSAVLDALGLSRDRATPAELLARAPSESPHDTIQVVPEPTELADGSLVRTFLVSGVRHARQGSPKRVDRALSGLAPETQLDLVPEPENPADPRALQLVVRGVVIGWIPSYLVEEIHQYLDSSRTLSFVVERANGPEAPWHLRVLCRLMVSPALEQGVR
jgi:transcriptional regulator with XRE-family HTH domain